MQLVYLCEGKPLWPCCLGMQLGVLDLLGYLGYSLGVEEVHVGVVRAVGVLRVISEAFIACLSAYAQF